MGSFSFLTVYMITMIHLRQKYIKSKSQSAPFKEYTQGCPDIDNVPKQTEEVVPIVEPLVHFKEDQILNSNPESLYRRLLFYSNMGIRILLPDITRSAVNVAITLEGNLHTQICEILLGRDIIQGPKGNTSQNDTIASQQIPNTAHRARSVHQTNTKAKNDQLSTLSNSSIQQVVQNAVRAIAIGYKMRKEYGEQLSELYKKVYQNTELLSEALAEYELISDISIHRQNATMTSSSPTVQGNIGVKALFQVRNPSSISTYYDPALAINHVKCEEAMYQQMYRKYSTNVQLTQQHSRTQFYLKPSLYEKVTWTDVNMPIVDAVFPRTEEIIILNNMLKEELLRKKESLQTEIMNSAFKGTVDQIFTRIADKVKCLENTEGLDFIVGDLVHQNSGLNKHSKVYRGIKHIISLIKDKIHVEYMNVPTNEKKRQPNLAYQVSNTLYDSLLLYARKDKNVRNLTIPHPYNNPYVNACIYQLGSGQQCEQFPESWIKYLGYCGVGINLILTKVQEPIYIIVSIGQIINYKERHIFSAMFKFMSIALDQQDLNREHMTESHDILRSILSNNISQNQKNLVEGWVKEHKLRDKVADVQRHVFYMIYQSFYTNYLRNKMRTIIRLTKLDLAECGKQNQQGKKSITGKVEQNAMWYWKTTQMAKSEFYLNIAELQQKTLQSHTVGVPQETLIQFQTNRAECLIYSHWQQQLGYVYTQCIPSLKNFKDDVIDYYRDKIINFLGQSTTNTAVVNPNILKGLLKLQERIKPSSPVSVHNNITSIYRWYYEFQVKFIQEPNSTVDEKCLHYKEINNNMTYDDQIEKLTNIIVYIYNHNILPSRITSAWYSKVENRKLKFTHGPLGINQTVDNPLQWFKDKLLAAVTDQLDLMNKDIESMINTDEEKIKQDLLMMMARDASQLFKLSRDTIEDDSYLYNQIYSNRSLMNEQNNLRDENRLVYEMYAKYFKIEDIFSETEHQESQFNYNKGQLVFAQWQRLTSCYDIQVINRHTLTGEFTKLQQVEDRLNLNECIIISIEGMSLLQIGHIYAVLKYLVFDTVTDQEGCEDLENITNQITLFTELIVEECVNLDLDELIKEYARVKFDKTTSRTYKNIQNRLISKRAMGETIRLEDLEQFFKHSSDKEEKHLVQTMPLKQKHRDSINYLKKYDNDFNEIVSIESKFLMESQHISIIDKTLGTVSNDSIVNETAVQFNIVDTKEDIRDYEKGFLLSIFVEHNITITDLDRGPCLRKYHIETENLLTMDTDDFIKLLNIQQIGYVIDNKLDYSDVDIDSIDEDVEGENINTNEDNSGHKDDTGTDFLLLTNYSLK